MFVSSISYFRGYLVEYIFYSFPQNPSSLNNTPRDPKELEQGFILDSVVTTVKASHRHLSHGVIPRYDAAKDKYAMAYFRSPTVKALMDTKAEHQVRKLN